MALAGLSPSIFWMSLRLSSKASQAAAYHPIAVRITEFAVRNRQVMQNQRVRKIIVRQFLGQIVGNLELLAGFQTATPFGPPAVRNMSPNSI